MTQRILWTLVGVMILNWSVTLYGPASIYWPITVLDVIAGLWGMFVVIGSWLDLEDYPTVGRWGNAFAWFNALLLVALIGAWAYIQFHNNPAYGTDELSFDQYAGQLVAHGLHNPYVHSMAPAGPLFRLSPDAYTYTITGTPVHALSYPSLSFLIYVPFLLLGWSNELGAGLDIAGWAVTIMLVFWMLPRSLRPAALLLGSVDVYLAFAAGGVTDMLYIPLLVVAAYRWDRFGTSRTSYINPAAMGLAMSIKQTPWPVIAFVLCALAWDEYDSRGSVEQAARRAGRYLAVAIGVFLIPNLPYMIASPTAWFRGVFQPFTANMVPAGQGLVSFTMFAHLGGGSLHAYTFVMVLVALLVLAVFIGTYPLLRPATFMLPSVFYFFAARSQTNYLIPFIPVAIVGAVTAAPAVARRTSRLGSGLRAVFRSRLWRRGIAGLAVLAAAAVVYALSATSPLGVRIVKFTTTGYLGGIRTLWVSVHNNTDGSLTPSYTVQTSHGDTTFWYVEDGPKTVGPGQTVRVHLAARNYPAEPGLSDGFSVLAFTDHPPAVSVSHRFLLNLWRTATSPQAFDDAEPIGKRLVVHVLVLDHFNSPVQQAGIPVYLSQIQYVSLGVRRGSAIINGHRPGKHKVKIRALTNSHGTATFYIVGTRPGLITFSAHLLNTRAVYVYASSGYLNIRFR